MRDIINIEPFGYFRALPFGWEDCSENDEGAMPLYDQASIDALEEDIRTLKEECATLQTLK